MKQERSLSPRRVSTQSLRCGHLGVRATPSEECLSRTQHKHCKSQLACDEPRSQHDEEALRTAVIDIQQLRLASRETTPFDAVNTAPKLRSGLPKSLASKRRQLVPRTGLPPPARATFPRATADHQRPYGAMKDLLQLTKLTTCIREWTTAPKPLMPNPPTRSFLPPAAMRSELPLPTAGRGFVANIL